MVVPSHPSSGLHLGDINVDVFLRLPRWPHPGHEVMLEKATWCPGGSATNTALTLARWGQRVRLLARLGRDPWGRALRKRLSTVPFLDLSLLQEDPERPTGTVFVLVDPQGERTFLTHRAANDGLETPNWERAFPSPPPYLHVTGFSGLTPGPRRVVETFLERFPQVPLALDVALYPAQHATEVVRLWAQRATLLSLTVEEARLVLKAPHEPPETLLYRLTQWAPIVALRMGREGAWLAWHGEIHHFPPLPIRPQDTTGAGDAFTAGLILGWLQGWEGETTGWLAHLLGALATTVTGAGDALPAPAHVHAWLQRHPENIPAHLRRRWDPLFPQESP